MDSHEHWHPLRVRAWLRAPVIADATMPLDGVLLYQLAREALGAREATMPGSNWGEQAVAQLRVPLKRLHDRQANWYYACSWAQWAPGTVEGRDFWNKRFDSGFADLIDFQGRRGRVIIEQNTYKAYHMPVYYRSSLWVEWYCVGAESEVRALLAAVTHLGKKPAQGWGRVLRWNVESIPEDWSVWKDGKLMRGVPPGDAPGWPLANRGIRPSYWERKNQMTLAVPG